MGTAGQAAEGSYRFAFAVEQNLGHRTHYQNLRRFVTEAADVAADWLPIEPGPPSPLARCLRPLGTNMTVRTSVEAWRAVRGARRSGPLDAVFFHTQTTALLSPFLRDVRAVVSLDATPINYDTLGEHYGHPVGGPLEAPKRWLHASVFRSAAALVTWSQWAKDSLVHDYGVQEGRITVVYPGVDLAAWPRPTPREPGPAGRLPKLLFVGGDFRRKGGETLLQGFRERLRGRCELHLVTQTPHSPGPGEFVYNDVKPNSETLRRLYAEADVFVFPTLADCLPQVVPEAMAAGLPVVTTRVGAIGEVVEHGISGFLIPPRDPVELGRALEELLERPELRRSMGEAGRQRVERTCDARTNALRIVEVLKGVSAPRPARAAPVAATG